MPRNYEGGIRNQRLEFVRETTQGDAPADPAWKRFADRFRSFNWTPDAQITGQRGVGTADLDDFLAGPESHTLEITYDLQQALVSGSNPNDAAGDGLLRDADNNLHNTHTVVRREDVASGGAASGGRRLYTVGLGGFIGDVTLTGDPSSENPVQVALSYQFEKVRSYRIDQPASSGTLTVKSTSASDTTQTLTIENEDAGTTEDVSLNGTTAVTTVASFADIDAAHLDAETVGDVTIEDGSANVLMTIIGSGSYPDGYEGDLGVPALGAGSHATAIGTAYERFLGDSVERPAGTGLALEINSAELSVSNNLQIDPQMKNQRQRIAAGARDIQLTADVVGETESHEKALEHLQLTQNDIVWTLTNSTVTMTAAALTESGGQTIEAEQATLSLSQVFTAKGLSIS